MSNYLFMLESHLSTDQNRVVSEVQAAARRSPISASSLAGGALRDMLGGFQIRDLDFVVEGNAPKLAKALTEKAGARVVSLDERRRTIELLFPGGVTAEIGMARKERYAKTGAQPQVAPAPIQEDLRRRDFTVNAIALSLNRASRGLLLDPMNGLGRLGTQRAANALPDRPLRRSRSPAAAGPAALATGLCRGGEDAIAIRKRARGEARNAHSAARAVRGIEADCLASRIRRKWSARSSEEGLLALISPALTGAKLNLAGLAKLEKAQKLLPPE